MSRVFVCLIGQDPIQNSTGSKNGGEQNRVQDSRKNNGGCPQMKDDRVSRWGIMEIILETVSV